MAGVLVGAGGWGGPRCEVGDVASLVPVSGVAGAGIRLASALCKLLPMAGPVHQSASGRHVVIDSADRRSRHEK